MTEHLFRLALLSLVPALALGHDSATAGLGLGLLAGVGGLILEDRLRSWFERSTSFLVALALAIAGSTVGSQAATLGQMALFVAGCAGFHLMVADTSRGQARLSAVASLAVAPTAIAIFQSAWWQAGTESLQVSLFGAHGLLYGSPLLWAGFLGTLGLRGQRSGLARMVLAAIVPGTLALGLVPEEGKAAARALIWLPFLAPGMAWSFDRLRVLVARRPQGALLGAAVLLVAWNVLFMEQYRRHLLPADDTVSFAEVTAHSAALFSRYVGTPFAWPANWLFAHRLGTTPDGWDGVAGRHLFATSRARTTTIEVGDDASVFAADSALLLDGFGTRRTCEQGWCREFDGSARLFLPLDNVGTGDFVIRLRARGAGALQSTVEGAGTAIADLTDSLSDLTFRYPSARIQPGIRVLGLTVAGGGKVGVDRITLERDLGSGSAR